MGKTYRREKNIWDDDPVRFENRSSKKAKRKSEKQKREKTKLRVYDYDETRENSLRNR